MRRNKFLCFAVGLGLGIQASTQDKPNIIIIMADDMGFSDIGCYGGEIDTPNLDALAAGGMRFTQFYNAGRCCPTRASLLTGLYPHQTGVGYMQPMNKYNKPVRHIPEYQGFLNNRCVTIAEILKRSGYQTFMSGKWHVGAAEGQRPPDRGFDRFYGLNGGACHYFHPEKGTIHLDREPVKELPGDFYSTDYFAKYAARFIREAGKDRPFFLYLAFTAPHWPLHAWPEDIKKYRGSYLMGWDELRHRRYEKQKALGIPGREASLTPRHKDSHPWTEETDPDDMDLRMAVYAAMVERMDKGIGHMLDVLRSSGQYENTLIMFLSDNGGCAEPLGKGREDEPPGHPDSYQGYWLPWANASNTPFRLFKHWVHEGGIATPLIVHWPGHVPKGTVNRQQAGHVKDLMATCLDAADVDYPDSFKGRNILPTESHSLMPAMLDPAFADNHIIFWEHEGNRAVREGNWKLVSFYNEIHETMEKVGTGQRTGVWELYDLSKDRSEMHDLADEKPELLQQLKKKYHAWTERVHVRDWEEILGMGGYDK